MPVSMCVELLGVGRVRDWRSSEETLLDSMEQIDQRAGRNRCSVSRFKGFVVSKLSKTIKTIGAVTLSQTCGWQIEVC